MNRARHITKHNITHPACSHKKTTNEGVDGKKSARDKNACMPRESSSHQQMRRICIVEISRNEKSERKCISPFPKKSQPTAKNPHDDRTGAERDMLQRDICNTAPVTCYKHRNAQSLSGREETSLRAVHHFRRRR